MTLLGGICMKNRLFIRFLAIIFACLFCATTYAHDVPDMDRLCSLTITLRNGEEPVSGGSLELYYVGSVKEDDGNYSFIPAGAFVSCNENFERFEDADLAARLKKYADDNGIEPDVIKNIGEDGNAAFEALSVGLYLVSQSNPADGYLTIDSFLVSLPYMEDGVYKYELVSHPKTELEQDENETDTPVDPELPQTGLLWWPVPVLLCAGLTFFVLGVLLYRRKKGNEN